MNRAANVADRGVIHSALLYDGLSAFLETAVPFVEDGLSQGETVLVLTDQEKGNLLQREVGPAEDRVQYADMREIGRNPARIIPEWHRFLARHLADGARGIGEPVWDGRSEAELEECYIHEALLNTAFSDGPTWQLICPYATDDLSPLSLAAAGRTHPTFTTAAGTEESGYYTETSSWSPDTLPRPPAHATPMPFSVDDLATMRQAVIEDAIEAGLARARADDLVVAVNEVATNSVRFGGGGGTLTGWRQNGHLVYEITDHGHVEDFMVGRIPPSPEQIGGRGLWLTNQMCDLVQLRSDVGRTTVRLHMAIIG